MVSSLNGASSQQVSIANPFQQRQDPQDRVQNDKKSGQSQNVFQAQSSQKDQTNRTTTVARASFDQDNAKPKNASRGSLVDITV